MPLVARTDSADAEKGDYGKDLVVTGVRDVPDAAAALTANIANVELSPEENKRLLRKIGESRRILPLLSRSRSTVYSPYTRLGIHPITFYPILTSLPNVPADFNILPLLCCVYFIQFLDKTVRTRSLRLNS